MSKRVTRNCEFFVDEEGVLYRRNRKGNDQLVVPRALVTAVIHENHDPIYASHPGRQRTSELISLNYWWPRMRFNVEEYVKQCDKCQRRKGGYQYRAPLGDLPEPTEPFQVTSMDITGPYSLTPRKNKYLLTFIDNFTRYPEAFPIPDISAETCARVYATQIITRHGSGSVLITDQGKQLTSVFFQETCKVLNVKKVQSSPYHPQSNSVVERLHKSLHDALAHYVDSTGTNWDTLVPFF